MPRLLFATLAALVLASATSAATLNNTGLVTNNVIFGSGNANGSFSGVTTGGLELGLRAKLRYDSSTACGGFGCAQNTFNYSGGDTYAFTDAASNQPANRSAFNFEWSINTNADGAGGALNSYSYRIDIDTDPTWNANSAVSYNPLSLVSTGYYLGTNASGPGGATFRLPGTGNFGLYNLAQNSVNMGFLSGAPLGSGRFTIRLSAFGPGNLLAATTAIHVIVDAPAPVPLPASLPALSLALGGLGLATRQRRAAKKSRST